MTTLPQLINTLTEAYTKLQEFCPFADPNDKAWIPAGEKMVSDQDKVVNDVLSALCSYVPLDESEAKSKADTIMAFHGRDPGNMLADAHLRLLCECRPMRLTSERINLLNELELETTYQRDLLSMIADNLNEVFPDDIAARSKDYVRMATTLTMVARDRIDAAYALTNQTYSIEEQGV
ncbi:hypothetical protein [Brucella gallinifaecis]|uniref:hypothetical protein n=1 Tax=Brucella gallinifaecis TaxID=215590 RepID=UPI002360AB0D|nr:hypothetical protein [Brucella gallinifaecis]